MAGYDGDVLYDCLYSFKVNLKILPQISEIIPLEIVHNLEPPISNNVKYQEQHALQHKNSASAFHISKLLALHP